MKQQNKLNGFEDRQMKILDWVHATFLFYSGAHNTLNAWSYGTNGLFFVFVMVGIISVELVLWGLYKYWKAGNLVGKMLNAAKYTGLLAMFFATAGILAQAQVESNNTWLTIYYQWILPMSAPSMFLCVMWIQFIDPVMTAQRDEVAYRTLLTVEKKRELLDVQRMKLDQARDYRRLTQHLHRQKMVALFKESVSRRVKNELKTGARKLLPNFLQHLGIRVGDNKKLTTRWGGRYVSAGEILEETQTNGHSTNGHSTNGHSNDDSSFQ